MHQPRGAGTLDGSRADNVASLAIRRGAHPHGIVTQGVNKRGQSWAQLQKVLELRDHLFARVLQQKRLPFFAPGHDKG